jgi:cell division protease FtsH
VTRLVDDGYQTANNWIDENRDQLELIANGLLEYETLDGVQVADIVRTGTFTPPPKPPVNTSPMMGAPAGTPLPETPPKPAPPKLPGGLGTPAPAPAG